MRSNEGQPGQWAKVRLQIVIYEYNAPTAKDTAETRDQPPLTTDELTAIATSRAWTASITADRATATNGLFAPCPSDPSAECGITPADLPN